jgi:hypothetical protein
MFCARGRFTFHSSLCSSVLGGRDAVREPSSCCFPPCLTVLAIHTLGGVILVVGSGFSLSYLCGLAARVMPIPTECNIQILYSSLEVVSSPWAVRFSYGALLPKLIPPCMLSTSIPTEQGGCPQLESLHHICALTKLGQRLPIYQWVVILFSNDCANVGCIP